jgi:hypothetical protein
MVEYFEREHHQGVRRPSLLPVRAEHEPVTVSRSGIKLTTWVRGIFRL